MKKSTLILLTIFSLTSCKSSNFIITKTYNSDNNAEFVRESEFDANGNIKYMKVYSFRNNNTTIFRPEYKNGLLIKLSEFNTKDKIETYTNYIYDKNDICLKEILFDSKNNQIMTSDYNYASNEKLASISHKTINAKNIEIFHYNNNGLIEKSVLYNSNHDEIETINYYYDHKNLLVRKDKYDSEDQIISYNKYRYDADIRKYTLSDLKQDYNLVKDKINSENENISGTYVSLQSFEISPYDSINYHLTELKKLKFIDINRFEIETIYISGALPYSSFPGTFAKGIWKIENDILILNYSNEAESGMIKLNISGFENRLLECIDENNNKINYYKIEGE